MATRKTIGVLMGGISPEHPVSLVSGCGMLKNLDSEQYFGFPILISKTNTWIWPDPGSGNSAFMAAANAMVDTPEKAAACLQSPPQGWHVARFPDFKVFPQCDLMLIGLHGVGGEDGRLQGFEEVPIDSLAVAGVSVIAHLLELLTTFIGQPLVWTLIRESWPNTSLDNSVSKMEMELDR